MKVLLVGESWVINSTHIKGFDQFTETKYGEGGKWLIQALEIGKFEVDYMPCHIAANEFPTTLEQMQKYDVIIFSDIGSNTLLLTEDVFGRGKKMPNRLQLVKEFVENGGGFAMMGGYMTFQGIDGKAKYAHTAIAEILPIRMMESDDRFEAPEGVYPTIVDESHPVLDGVSKEWPHFLGYNMLFELDPKYVIAKCNDHIFMAGRDYGEGRTFAFASDISPHWGSPEFLQWESYNTLFSNIAKWLCKKI
ncbi:glutamine amidotransferase [Tissierella sp. Yu-01]|uniref:glutamine amidotransferase n=1 Tax=Tissierella sp. Yu-01 TaxID=3035694 RepID=UPI00240DE37B|nr:glutamine amidotransferase [Tissierella sp. Yu-01]WFA10401.1 glutamine amidotransferase [Tissierella sp. Yu-01]